MTSTTPTTLRPGLCSVTLREHSRADVVELARRNGLAAIEWGADRHVRPDDPAAVADAVERCRDAGVAIASYGTYLRLGSGEDPGPVVSAARALGAPRLRVWAGTVGSAEAGPEDRARVAAAGREVADRAAGQGLTVGLEFHGNTLTDTTASTLELLERIDRPGVLGTYWQPPVGLPADAALAGLDEVRRHLVGVHAFSWWPATERLPLSARRDLWDEVARRLHGEPFDVLLEFVAGDAPDRLAEDAAELRALLTTPGGAPTAP
ncbi:sugar phosphate isomerase/epimerase family protein [Pseudonocardia sp. HH130630-07]|uniref:sugar phosphate isomerase/epimerase family protein n=1 Tax=Pseudonocardia sp. HH130630-07 TaxID=1690815 RepID=UPI000815034A|nr:TIM barrel protein [Pseudonocardia sp. HH130630-07]ANY09364.1 hypothetical protein AFB00_27490 [Pseudonocardia sp. HH130630-07]